MKSQSQLKVAKVVVPTILFLISFILIPSLLWHRESSPYRTGRLALLAETSEGDSLYTVDLATNQLDFLFFPEGRGFKLLWSPDNKNLVVVGSFPTGLDAWIVDVTKRKFTEVGGWLFAWGSFYGWTSDGRYAIFSNGDQYGNSDTTVFDTWQWETIISTTATTKTCLDWHSMGGGCYRSVAGISPFTSTLLLKDGTMLNLTDLSETQVFSPGVGLVAKWSSDAKYLAVLRPQGIHQECHLYLANADCTQPLEMATLHCSDYQALQWEPDGKHAILFTKTARYVLDPMRQQVEILPAEVSPTQPASQGNDAGLCGNCDVFLNGESSLGEVTAACWSPDKALLAIGNVGNLNVYDADLNLLQTFVVSGTVKRLAWSLSDSD